MISPTTGRRSAGPLWASRSTRSSTFDWSLASSEPYQAANSSVPETSHTSTVFTNRTIPVKEWLEHPNTPGANMGGCCLTKKRRGTLNVSVETVRRLLAFGEIAACASDADLVDSLSVKAFRSAERERVGKILQEMVTDAEDMGLYDTEPLPFRR